MSVPPRVTRRECLGAALAAVAAGSLGRSPWRRRSCLGPAYSVIPVVGDGKWIWTAPPETTGYLEPRTYDLKIGIRIESRSATQQLKATTPIPPDLPEQTIEQLDLQTEGCEATLRSVGEAARQLVLSAPTVAAGQAVAAAATMRLTLRKQFLGHAREQFPQMQPTLPREFRQQFLSNSPGIEIRLPEIKRIAAEIESEHVHPWDRARACYRWVREHIHARVGPFTSVKRALRDRVGDCEERAAVFVALCRSLRIAARLVWVPNHNWAEFYLSDAVGNGHWIPAHTASYSWFGWTGAHELVLQKGDRLSVPELGHPQRLLEDWIQWKGKRPDVRFLAELTPLPPAAGEDPGPGARVKNADGKWVLQARHPLDRQLRDGSLGPSNG